MVWSLHNEMEADAVKAILDRARQGYEDDPNFKPGIERERAEAIIHAVIWAAGCRSDSTSAAIAHDALFKAIGEDMIDRLQMRLKFEKRCEARALRALKDKQP